MPLLTLNNITMNYGPRRILDGVSFRVNKGDRIAFIGDNGAGKSTLFKIIKGTLTPDDGEVILHQAADRLKQYLHNAEALMIKDGKSFECLTFSELCVYLKHVEGEIE